MCDSSTYEQLIDGGSGDDIYNWATSLAEITPVPSGVVRAEKLFGFEKFGYCRDLPADRKQTKGVYLSDLKIVDVKINWLVAKCAHPFVY